MNDEHAPARPLFCPNPDPIAHPDLFAAWLYALSAIQHGAIIDGMVIYIESIADANGYYGALLETYRSQPDFIDLFDARRKAAARSTATPPDAAVTPAQMFRWLWRNRDDFTKAVEVVSGELTATHDELLTISGMSAVNAHVAAVQLLYTRLATVGRHVGFDFDADKIGELWAEIRAELFAIANAAAADEKRHRDLITREYTLVEKRRAESLHREPTKVAQTPVSAPDSIKQVLGDDALVEAAFQVAYRLAGHFREILSASADPDATANKRESCLNTLLGELRDGGELFERAVVSKNLFPPRSCRAAGLRMPNMHAVVWQMSRMVAKCVQENDGNLQSAWAMLSELAASGFSESDVKGELMTERELALRELAERGRYAAATQSPMSDWDSLKRWAQDAAATLAGPMAAATSASSERAGDEATRHAPSYLGLIVNEDNHTVERDGLFNVTVEFGSKEKPWKVFLCLWHAKGHHRSLKEIDAAGWELNELHEPNTVQQAIGAAKKLLARLNVTIKGESGPRYYLADAKNSSDAPRGKKRHRKNG